MKTDKVFNNILPWTNVQVRNGAFPLEQYSIFESLSAAKEYALSNAVAYEGQVIAVTENGMQKVYVLDSSNTTTGLTPVGDTSEILPVLSTLSGAIDAEVSARIADINVLSGEIKDIKEVSLGELSSYEVTVTEAETAEAGYLKTYVIKQGNKLDAKINIPKDFLVKSAEVKDATDDSLSAQGILIGDKYIDFVVNAKEAEGEASHVYLKVTDLVDVYTGLSSDTIELTVNGTEISATVKDGSIGWTKLDAEVNSWKTSVELSTANLCAEVAANDADIAYISGQVNLSVAALEGQIAQVASDASDAAASALTDAKAYTNEVSAGLSVDTKIAEAKKYAEVAAISVLADAKTYVDDLSIADTYATKAELEAHETEFTALIDSVSAEAITSANAYTDAKIDEKIGQIDFAKLSTDTLNDAKAYTDQEVEALSTSLSNEITAVQETVAANLTTAEGYAISVLGDAKAYANDLSTSLSNEVIATYATKTELANKGQELSDYVDSKVADLNIGDYATKAEVEEISGNHEGRIATLESGTSALSGRMDKVERDITSISNDYATKEYVNTQDAATLSTANKYTDDKIATLGNPLRFVGVVNAVTDVENPQDGDVVLVGTKEFVYNNGNWTEFGDESTHATVTALEAEKQAREAADAYISAAVDNKIFAGDYGNIVSADSLSVIKISQADYANLLADEKADPNAVYIVNSDGAYDMYGERVINVATPELSTDAANKDYVDTEIAKAKAEVIAEIPLSVSQLTWDISAIYCGGAND